MAEVKFGLSIKNLRCDRGGEYVSNEFVRFCDSEGIRISYTMPRNPSQNGKAERMNRTILEKARCLLFDSDFKKDMWGESIMTAIYLINRLPTSTLPNGVTPAERWYGFKPDLGKIKIFGCPVYSLIHEEDRNGKLCERSKRLFMAGYCDNGYRLWNPNKKKIEFARNVIFDESRTTDLTNEGQFTNPDTVQIPCVDHETKSEVFQSSDVEQVLQPMLEDEDLPILEDEDFQSDKNIDTVKKTSRIRKPPKYLEDFVTNFAFDALALSASSDLDVPNNYTDAVQDAGWRQAIDEELKSLEDNGTWEVVDSPIDATVIDSRWVFTTKIVDGAVMKKARLVSRGYQQPSLEDENIFAPVARLPTLRVLLAVAVERGLHIHQLDVKSAFLKSNLA
ncbi:unnamed protein product [Pieris macdunnoughi]|uniref:Integrase catalytic domain-containing protein n=1 Tax=Pieris macdunnoughi TaxID=345717 RepID=A0A821X3I1_9NEOP|nr:unnamed protein product [Pieris macdunnoughi]